MLMLIAMTNDLVQLRAANAFFKSTGVATGDVDAIMSVRGAAIVLGFKNGVGDSTITSLY